MGHSVHTLHVQNAFGVKAYLTAGHLLQFGSLSGLQFRQFPYSLDALVLLQ